MLDRAEHGCFATRSFQYRLDEVRRCGFAVRSCDADQVKPFRRMAIKVASESRHGAALVFDLNPWDCERLNPRLRGNDCHRALSNSLGNVAITSETSSTNSNEQIPLGNIPRIVSKPENLGVEVTASRTDLAVRQQLAQFHVF